MRSPNPAVAGFEDSGSTELAEVLSDEAQALFVDRSSRPRLRGALQNQDVGEVGRTKRFQRLLHDFGEF
jgi:hypothetical protein